MLAALLSIGLALQVDCLEDAPVNSKFSGTALAVFTRVEVGLLGGHSGGHGRI